MIPFSGYCSQKEPRVDTFLTSVGPGSPCGEYLRRFWHPVMKTEDLCDLPKLPRHLGEDLVIFQNKSGRCGLVHKHCPHRNVSFEFGILTEQGIRCCYHGWEFDIDGTIIRAPAESDDTLIRENVCLGAYPVKEFPGITFAYLGLPEKWPEFSFYDTYEIEDGELVQYEVTIKPHVEDAGWFVPSPGFRYVSLIINTGW
jgi:phenylpropionate dioxygenase-like ring-hydroxylating dioxygenase large terminal subunit